MILNNYILPEKWLPADGFILEDEAMTTVLSSNNTLVVAGPGAGKTELLAQRACYLLETNTCKYPQKILAISFKKDAAENLQERVEKRCGKELALRFESKTYDAFAKEILDRFSNSLEEMYRPNKIYDIAESKDIKKAFVAAGMNAKTSNRNYNNIYESKLEINKLPLNSSDTSEIFIKTWNILLKENKESKLSFKMISRMSELLLRKNKYLQNSLEMTYSHVFLDEFQDTTEIQYDLFKTCFLNTAAVITAVGDAKQRIMVWAGALKTIFEDYKNDFNAIEINLIMNHRSSPRLVEIQKMMYNSLNQAELQTLTNNKWSIDDGEAYLHLFENHIDESKKISNEIELLSKSGIDYKDICILVKQQVDIYGKEIIYELREKGIKARNESVYQDMLKEEIIKILISIFRLSFLETSPDDWNFMNRTLSILDGINDNANIEIIYEIQSRIDEMTVRISESLKTTTQESFVSLVNYILDEVSVDKIKSIHQQYKHGSYFQGLIDKFIRFVWEEYKECNNWELAFENFIGLHSVPIMTIHKSKGLEFHTIFFVGIEDSAFWNFRNQPDEDRCAFFVALSRAKSRIDFTFCKNRPLMFSDIQSKNTINEFYELFENSNVVETIIHDL